MYLFLKLFLLKDFYLLIMILIIILDYFKQYGSTELVSKYKTELALLFVLSAQYPITPHPLLAQLHLLAL